MIEQNFHLHFHHILVGLEDEECWPYGCEDVCLRKPRKRCPAGTTCQYVYPRYYTCRCPDNGYKFDKQKGACVKIKLPGK